MNKIKMRIVWFVLAASLCFNIFFSFGFLSSRNILKKLMTPEGRMELVVKRLDLSEAQKESFKQSNMNLRSQVRDIRHSYLIDINTYWREVVKEDPDSQQIKALLDHISQGRKEFMFLATDYILELLRELTPEQRKAYIKILRKEHLGSKT